MSGWKEYRLGDIANVKGGKRLPKGSNLITKANKHPYIRVRDLGTKKVLELDSSYEYVDDETQKKIAKYIVNEGDIIISIVGTIGLVAIIGCSLDDANLTENCVKLINIKEIDREYLYYYLVSDRGKNEIEKGVVGAVQAKLPIKNIQSIIIKAPDINDQKRIASILSTIDSKIECNRRINENLEQQAQALFKSWFVDFEPFKDHPFVESELGMIPQGWKVVSIGELPIIVTDYVANGSFASLKENVKLYQEEEYAYFIRNTDLKSGDFGVFVDKHSYDFLSKSRLFGGEIIISNVGDVGSVFLCPRLNKPMTLGNNIIMIKAEEDLVNTYLYILFRWSYGQGLIKSITGGSAQPKFNKTDFKSLKLIMPSESIVSNYVSKLRSMIDVVESNKKEIKCLAELRDTLLPKLMSGELNVENVNF